MWQQIARQVGFYCSDWQAADTSAYLLLRILLGDAQRYAMTYGIAISKGLGKTFTAGQYLREHSECWYVGCNGEYNRRSFMHALMNACGVARTRNTVPGMMDELTRALCEREQPLLVLDDAELLKDRVLHLVVLLANALAGKAGIVILGGDRLRTKITEGVRLKKAGYDEIYQSIGRRFITLTCLAPADAELVCLANGMEGDTIAYIKENSHDLHDVARMIQEQKEMRSAA
jgi:hypothetical protein